MVDPDAPRGDPDPDAAFDVDVTVRQARIDDAEGVVAFTSDTWERLDGDYIPRVFESWVEGDGPTQRTLVATVDDASVETGAGDDHGDSVGDDDPVGICQGVLLSEDEAWAQGMRVAPAYRGAGIGAALTEAVFEWASRQGATVCRNMVFSWNAAGLGQSRGLGFEPLTSFRWIEPDPGAASDPDVDHDFGSGSVSHFEVLSDPALAWRVFHGSDAYRELVGLGLDLEESWALAEVTSERLEAAPETIVVADEDRASGMTYRTRTFEREVDDAGDESDATERWAEYGVAAWDDHETLRALAAAVVRDAAAQGAEHCRVLVPETPRHVSDAAYARVDASEEPDFVMERDLTRY